MARAIDPGTELGHDRDEYPHRAGHCSSSSSSSSRRAPCFWGPRGCVWCHVNSNPETDLRFRTRGLNPEPPPGGGPRFAIRGRNPPEDHPN